MASSWRLRLRNTRSAGRRENNVPPRGRCRKCPPPCWHVHTGVVAFNAHRAFENYLQTEAFPRIRGIGPGGIQRARDAAPNLSSDLITPSNDGCELLSAARNFPTVGRGDAPVSRRGCPVAAPGHRRRVVRRVAAPRRWPAPGSWRPCRTSGFAPPSPSTPGLTVPHPTPAPTAGASVGVSLGANRPRVRVRR
jgi:hypothetical protein